MNRSKKSKTGRRIMGGLLLGAVAGYLASYIAGHAGSQCTILCNQAVAIPYFAAMGILVAWR